MPDKLSEQTKQLRNQYIHSFNSDGLLDFFVGWALVSAGLFLLTRATLWSFAGWMPMLLMSPLKQRFIIPRFGYAKLSKPATIPRPLLIGAGFVLVIGSLLVTFLGESKGSLAIGLLGVALLVVLDQGLNRLAVYAIFVPLFFIVGLGFKLLTPPLVILVGAVLMALGCFLFLRFLKKYPLPGGSEAED